MFCPRCCYDKTKVNGTVKGLINIRQRMCPKCGYVWQTKEVVSYDFYPKFYLKSLFEDEEREEKESKGQS